jgi:hypothetical protein
VKCNRAPARLKPQVLLEALMLDIHPPHHPASSWRDFFIHIATIVVGLLIAIGLEQTLEHLHDRHGIAKAREHIRIEVEVNQRILGSDQEQMTQVVAQMKRNLDILHALGTPQADAAATLSFSWNLQNFYDAAYHSAKDSGSLARMPYDESAMYGDAYTVVTLNTEGMIDLIKDIYAAKALLQGRNPSELSPAEIAGLRTSIAVVIGQAGYYQLTLDQSKQEWESILTGNFRNDITGSGS